MKHVIFSVDQLKIGEMRSVRVDNITMVLARTPDGAVHALKDACSHEGARLSMGWVQPMVRGDDAGRYQVVKDRFVVRCPRHGFEFDLETGDCVADPTRHRVRAYRVSVDDGDIVVER